MFAREISSMAENKDYNRVLLGRRSFGYRLNS
jgi:hypothetical protein